MTAVLASIPGAGGVAAHVQPPDDALRLDLEEHGIGFILPRGASLKGDLDLPGGALIFGAVHGRIRCKQGTLILAQGSDFSGKAEATMVYICGTVRSISKTEPSEIQGAVMVAVSSTAAGRASLISRQFAIHTRTFAGKLHTLS